jgi:hypothetical protein
MANIESAIRQINKELVPQFESRLREHLASQDREWLIEQIVRLTLDAHSLREMDRRHLLAVKAARRQERMERVRKLAIDRAAVVSFIATYASYNRDYLIREGFLRASAPEKGTALLTAEFQTP